MTTVPLACDMSALDRDERVRHHALLGRLVGAVRSRNDIERGWELILDRGDLSVAEIGEWISLEARCCPFLRFELEVPPGDDMVRLRLRAAVDVREFLRAEMNLG